MNLKDRLQDDLHQAMRDRDAQRKSALRLAWASITNEEIARQHQLGDEEVLGVLMQEVKRHQESLSEFEKAGRGELVAQERAQLEALQPYLPKQMSQTELSSLVSQAIEETDAKDGADLGRVMRWLMPRVKGRADGRAVNELVRERLSTLSRG